MKTLGEMLAENDFTVFVHSKAELQARLEAGHRVEYRYKGAYIISQKRGQEYVTVSAQNEAQAQADWKKLHERGVHYDELNRRQAVPGARG